MEAENVLQLFNTVIRPELNDYQKGKKDYKCDICEKIIVGFPSTLKRHKTHVHKENKAQKGIRNHKCDECEKIIVGYPSTLKSHKVFVHGDNPVHKCDVCGKTFKRTGDLNVHVKNHDKGPQFECKYCKKKMSKKTNLMRHQEKFCSSLDKSNLQYQCTECPKKFFSERGRDRHEITHDQSPVQCPVCSEFRINLRRHIKEVHQTKIKSFECNTCKLRFSRQKTLTNHQEAYCKARPRAEIFTCNYSECKSTFDAELKLKTHIRTMHVNPLPKDRCICECGKGFRSNSDLQRHKLKHNEPQYECQDCGRKFYDPISLNSHKGNVHNPDITPVKCHICETELKSGSVLKTHMRRMHGAGALRQFKCSSCDSTFKTGSELERHERIHNGTKDGKCPICGKEFRTKGMVWAHMHVHKETKDFQCNMCDKEFKYQMTLQKHQKREHFGQAAKGSNLVLLSTLYHEREACELCGKDIPKSNMKNHLKYHEKLPEFECNSCNFSTKTKDNLRKHIRNVHSTKKCQRCGKIFSTNHLLTNHLKRNRCSSPNTEC